MPTPLTPTPVEIAATCNIPSDTESANSDSLALFTQPILNAIKFSTNLGKATKAIADQWAIYTLNGTLANATRVTLNFSAGSADYTLSDTNRRIVVPANGVYLVTMAAAITLTNTANPSLGMLKCYGTTASAIKPFGPLGAQRFSASTGDLVLMTGAWLCGPIAGAREIQFISLCPGGSIAFQDNVSPGSEYTPQIAIQRLS